MGNCIGYMYIKDMDNKKKSKTQALLNHDKYYKQNKKTEFNFTRQPLVSYPINSGPR